MENPIKMDDLGIPWFLETPKFREVFVEPAETSKSIVQSAS